MTVDGFLARVRAAVKRSQHFSEDKFEVRQNLRSQTLCFFGTAVMRIAETKKGVRLELADRYFGGRAVSGLSSYRKPKDGWVKLDLSDNVAELVVGDLQAVYDQCYDEQPAEGFGCCSRYIQCSDEKKCVHPDQDHARGCAYKANLDEGRVFYGKNRNVGI